MDTVLLTPDEMATADRFTIAAGTPGIVLMERAGAAVAAAIRRRRPLGGRVVVLAGAGNNGGDGFVAARRLRDDGYRVTVAFHGDLDRLRGDARIAADSYRGPVVRADAGGFAGADVIVDALYGAGLRLPLPSAAVEVIRAVNASGAEVVAVDLPSGVEGADGLVGEAAVEADATVTFFRMKPGHLLLPGRLHCGAVTMVDIGIPAEAAPAPAMTRLNRPAAWLDGLPFPAMSGHKYDRGHALVLAGPAGRGGAARLAAGAALRIGAGLVTVGAPGEAIAENAAQLNAVMLHPVDGPDDLAGILADRRMTCVVMGPGLGAGEATARLVEAALASGTAAVLDADALSAFAGRPARLLEALAGAATTILTPHAGEFARVFPDLVGPGLSRLEGARRAAERSGAVVLYKGADTVVAGPDGRAVIADNAPPELATAGAGDVLAGMAGGLLAAGMPALEAAAAAVWIHGAAAAAVGAGLIAEDLAPQIPAILARLKKAAV